jgi:hypothetical protein
MIGTLALLLTSDELSASRFFPLAAGNRWVYEDSMAPGTTFESVVKQEVKTDAPDPIEIQRLKDAGKDPDIISDSVPQFYPVEMREDGSLRQVICYREKDSTLLQVGTGINKPMVPLPMMVVSKKPYDWDFYSQNINEYLSEAIHYVASSSFGPIATVLGKPHQTLVVNMTMTVGPKKTGVELKQVLRYAADVGLYELSEDGHIGKNLVHHIRHLVKFETGGSV